MTNQYHILPGEAPLDLINADVGIQGMALMLYAGGSDAGAYPKAPQDFEPSLHLLLMSAYWRHVEARPEQASPIADSDLDSSEDYYTPESWLEYRNI